MSRLMLLAFVALVGCESAPTHQAGFFSGDSRPVCFAESGSGFSVDGVAGERVRCFHFLGKDRVSL